MPRQATSEEAQQNKAGLLLAIRQIHHWGLDLLFPPRCAICGQVDTNWCARCTALLLEYPLIPQTDMLANGFEIISSGVHQGILQEALHNLKYMGQTHLAPLLATRLSSLLAQTQWQPDFIIPVPMHPKRLAQRGYNQAELLAYPLAETLGIACQPHAIERTRDTISQVGLSAQQRQENVKDVFKVHQEQIRGKIVVIVDDVLTTGATLSGCANTLLDEGAKAVFGITVTRASDNR